MRNLVSAPVALREPVDQILPPGIAGEAGHYEDDVVYDGDGDPEAVRSAEEPAENEPAEQSEGNGNQNHPDESAFPLLHETPAPALGDLAELLLLLEPVGFQILDDTEFSLFLEENGVAIATLLLLGVEAVLAYDLAALDALEEGFTA